MKKQGKLFAILRKGTQLIIVAIAVGIVAGLGGALYLGLVSTIFNFCFVGNFSFVFNRELLAPDSRWGIGLILVPVLGGLVVTWIIKTFGDNQRGVSAPDLFPFIKEEVAKKSYVIELAKSFASTITIGTGGSVGQEIPIVQLGATLSYLLTRLFHLSAKEKMVLLAAGSAASLGAVFNAPFTGIMFATEILLFGFSFLAVCLVALSAFVGAHVGQYFFGSKIVFKFSLLPIESWKIFAQNLLMFIPLGILLGFVAVLFNSGLNRTENLFTKTFKNAYIRHSIGMVLVGILLYGMLFYTGHYYIDRLGHATIQQVLDTVISSAYLLLLILVCKLLSLWITLGSGASGGIFTPSLFLGAMVGALSSIVLQNYFPGIAVDHVYFVVCGMGGMLAGVTGAVLTAIVFILEMTNNYQITIYLIETVLLSTFIRLLFYPKGIYTFKLFQRGLMFERKWW